MSNITYEDFKKMDIRVAKVIKAEQILGKTKILKLTVDIGLKDPRSIIAGGADFCKPEYFAGKKFIVLTNLAPRKIAGIESQGMLLAADTEGGKPIWLITDGDAPIGARII